MAAIWLGLEGVIVGDPGRLTNDLGHRPVGNALAVGQAPAAQDNGTFAEARKRLFHQPGLADSSSAQHGYEQAGPFNRHPVEGIEQQLALPLAADHGDVATAAVARNVRSHGQQPPSRYRFGLTLEGQRHDPLGLYRIPYQLPGRAPEQYPSRGSRLLQARGYVGCVA
jgi:hypothetical protein